MNLLITLLLAGCIYSQQPDYGCLTVKVENIREVGGFIVIALFDNKADFLKSPQKFVKVPVGNHGTVTGRFESLKYGEYSLSVYHDVNENDELDTNWVGIPKEAIGFSNNKMGVMGPPSFKECLIPVRSENHEITIQLKTFL